MKNLEYKVDVFTGIRPSGGLTIANVIGSVNTIVTLQKEEKIGRPMVFVADLHALTDAEPKDTQKHVFDIVKDYIALGLDPQNCDIFIQSHLIEEIAELNIYLSRLITVSELLRVPTLKEKIKRKMDTSAATLLLAMYPVMMASDILLQKSKFVPVGEDQEAHIEIARYFARKFNKAYGETIPVPNILSLGVPIRIKSLYGEGKMSKSNPSGAILIDDPVDISLNKIKKAQSAFAGVMTDSLESLIKIGEYVSNEEEKKVLEDIVKSHMNGKNVMGELKTTISLGMSRYLEEFQQKKSKIVDSDVEKLLQEGGKKAKGNAKETIKEVRESMGLKYI